MDLWGLNSEGKCFQCQIFNLFNWTWLWISKQMGKFTRVLDPRPANGLKISIPLGHLGKQGTLIFQSTSCSVVCIKFLRWGGAELLMQLWVISPTGYLHTHLQCWVPLSARWYKINVINLGKMWNKYLSHPHPSSQSSCSEPKAPVWIMWYSFIIRDNACILAFMHDNEMRSLPFQNEKTCWSAKRSNRGTRDEFLV